jgi:CBS domain-containing protein
MVRDVLTVSPGTAVSDVSEMLKLHNIKGAPVVDRKGILVGIITEDDLVFGQLGISEEEMELMRSPGTGARGDLNVTRRVAEIMTENPIAAEEDTPVEELCRLMSRLKIHRIPIVTIDICKVLADGHARLVPVHS